MLSAKNSPVPATTHHQSQTLAAVASEKSFPIEIHGQRFEYIPRYSARRKTVQLKLTSPSLLSITAPRGFSRPNLEKIILEKSAWITAAAARLSTTAAIAVNQSIAPGEIVLYRGRPHSLSFVPGFRPAVTVVEEEIRLHYPPSWEASLHSGSRMQQLLYSWFREEANRMLVAKTLHWAALIGVHPKNVRVKEQKSRWGSCSSLGNINYNWRLIMTPPAVTDYLVVHELCHLLEPNHSSRFWHLVQQYLPAYAEQRHWLKQNGRLLSRLFAE